MHINSTFMKHFLVTEEGKRSTRMIPYLITNILHFLNLNSNIYKHCEVLFRFLPQTNTHTVNKHYLPALTSRIIVISTKQGKGQIL